MDKHSDDFDVAEALDFIVENPSRVTQPEMLAVMSEAAATIEELRREVSRKKSLDHFTGHKALRMKKSLLA